MTNTKAAKGFIVKTAATYVGFAADANAVAAIAKEADFSISADDLKNAQSKLKLSDEEVEGMAGGGAIGCYPMGVSCSTALQHCDVSFLSFWICD